MTDMDYTALANMDYAALELRMLAARESEVAQDLRASTRPLVVEVALGPWLPFRNVPHTYRTVTGRFSQTRPFPPYHFWPPRRSSP